MTGEWTYKKFTAEEMEKLFNLAAKLPSDPDRLENPKGHDYIGKLEDEEYGEELRREKKQDKPNI